MLHYDTILGVPVNIDFFTEEELEFPTKKSPRASRRKKTFFKKKKKNAVLPFKKEKMETPRKWFWIDEAEKHDKPSVCRQNDSFDHQMKELYAPVVTMS